MVSLFLHFDNLWNFFFLSGSFRGGCQPQSKERARKPQITISREISQCAAVCQASAGTRQPLAVQTSIGNCFLIHSPWLCEGHPLPCFPRKKRLGGHFSSSFQPWRWELSSGRGSRPHLSLTSLLMLSFTQQQYLVFLEKWRSPSLPPMWILCCLILNICHKRALRTLKRKSLILWPVLHCLFTFLFLQDILNKIPFPFPGILPVYLFDYYLYW